MELLSSEMEDRGRSSLRQKVKEATKKKKKKGIQSCAPYTVSICLEKDKSFSNSHKTNVMALRKIKNLVSGMLRDLSYIQVNCQVSS